MRIAAAFRQCFRPLLVAALLLACPPASRASMTEEGIDLAWLWTHADCVIEGTVLDVTFGWAGGGARIQTYVQLDVTAVDQGACSIGPRTLTLLGGVMDSLSMVVKGAPSFAPGEHVMLFLDERPGRFIPTLGMDLGKMTIGMDPQTGRERIGNEHLGWFDREALFAPMLARRRSGK